jgi:GMP synthase (glutamine-hydrolysing)
VKPLVILKLGDTFEQIANQWGDFEDWIAQSLGSSQLPIQVVDFRRCGRLPHPDACAGLILTGSHSMVTDKEPWSEQVARWIPEVVESEVPFLGICYGHQLLAHALNGTVGPNPRGPQFGTVSMTIRESAAADPLFAGIASPLRVQTSHFQSVHRLPAEATCLGSTEMDPHHAFVVGTCAWGLQFHPEYRPEVAQAYIELSADALRQRGLDPDQLHNSVEQTTLACQLLLRFAKLSRARAA